MIQSTGDRTLSECFKLFDVIHQITTDHETITGIASEVVEDFAADNVRYLELRTTPKVCANRQVSISEVTPQLKCQGMPKSYLAKSCVLMSYDHRRAVSMG